MNEREARLARIPVGEVLEETFKTVFQRIVPIGVIIIAGALISGIGLFLAGDSVGLSFINQVLSFVVSMIIIGFIVFVVKDRRENQYSQIGETLGLVAPHLVSLIISTFLKALAIMLGLLLLIFPGVYLAIRWSMSESAIVNEGLGPIDGLKRSFEITKELSWRIFLIYLILALIVFGVALALFPLYFLVGLFMVVSPILGTIFAILIFVPIITVLYALVTVWVPVVYFRLEGDGKTSNSDQEMKQEADTPDQTGAETAPVKEI